MLNLYPEEKVIATFRRHWFIVFNHILITIIIAVVPLFIFGIFGGLIKDFSVNYLKNLPFNRLFFSLYTIYLLYIWSYFSVAILDYYLDVWIVTNKRVIDVEQKGLFNREISEFPLEKIEDITVTVKGLIETFLGFGDLHVKTASESAELIFHKIPHPEKAKNIILEQYHKLKITGANSHG